MSGKEPFCDGTYFSPYHSKALPWLHKRIASMVSYKSSVPSSVAGCTSSLKCRLKETFAQIRNSLYYTINISCCGVYSFDPESQLWRTRNVLIMDTNVMRLCHIQNLPQKSSSWWTGHNLFIKCEAVWCRNPWSLLSYISLAADCAVDKSTTLMMITNSNVA